MKSRDFLIRTIKLVALCLLFGFILSANVAFGQIDKPVTLLSGLRFNNGQAMGSIGFAVPVSDKFWSITTADMGGDEHAATTRFAYVVPISDQLNLAILASAHVEITKPNPDLFDTITYLNSATGIAIHFDPGLQAAFYFYFDYIAGDSPVKAHKLGLGLTTDLN